jgi:hypothetical protein
MNDNLGIGIMTSINLKERYMACKNTWLKDFDNTYLFGGNIPDENLIPIQSAGENWQSAFLKQQLGLKYMYEDNPNYDWYSISGCDNVLFKDRVMLELSKYNSKDDLFLSQPCGLWTDYPIIHQVEQPINGVLNFRAIAGGASFFISNSLMHKCYNIIDEFNKNWTNISNHHYGCSDVALSYMLKLYFNIDVTGSYHMLSQNPKHYEGAITGDENAKWYVDYPVSLEDAIKTPISLHYIKPENMEEIYIKYSK